jgi:uncharacterized protein (TIGR02611 family)
MTADQPVAPKPGLVRKLERQREAHRCRPKPVRWLYVAVGFTLILAGFCMLVLPGPAALVIPLGLAVLSLEFCWAQRWLDKSLVQADKAKRKAEQTSTTQRVLTAGAIVLALAAFGGWAVLGDVPLLPV